jgi:hypothetical protein
VVAGHADANPSGAGVGCHNPQSFGMTLDKAVPNMSRVFAPNQAYAALTRVCTTGGVLIEEPDKKLEDIPADATVLETMEATECDVGNFPRTTTTGLNELQPLDMLDLFDRHFFDISALCHELARLCACSN